MYFIKEINDLAQWNKAVIDSTKLSQFLQSWKWGDFQRSLGRMVWRLAVVSTETEQIVLLAMVIKYKLSLGKSYLYCPRAPLWLIDDKKIDQSKKAMINSLFIKQIRQISQQEQSIFLRSESIQTESEQLFTYRKQVKSVQPANTRILDLQTPKKQLLAYMHPKTRYNIHLAQRKGITVRIKRNQQDITQFINLMKQTTQRQGFCSYQNNYYQQLISQLARSSFSNPNCCFARLYLAESNKKILAANLVLFFGNTVTYLHGASNYHYRNLMAPYLLQWQQIQDAQQLGYRYYDFWGINPVSTDKGFNKKWSGFTRFKLGFSGQEINYPGTFDFPLQYGWYKLYCLVKHFRQIFR